MKNQPERGKKSFAPLSLTPAVLLYPGNNRRGSIEKQPVKEHNSAVTDAATRGAVTGMRRAGPAETRGWKLSLCLCLKHASPAAH